MTLSATEMDRLTLVVLRLMDADLLADDEASDLLAEIKACELNPDEIGASTTLEVSEPQLITLEALVQTNRLDVTVGKEAKSMVLRILHSSGGLGGPDPLLPD
jgi:hypothetical protein